MRLISALIVIQTLACLALHGQSTSRISGRIQDPRGLPVPGSEITATRLDTGNARSAQSAADGSYLLTGLPVGPYEIKIRKEGFHTHTQTGIVLQVDSAPAIDVTLQLGSVTEQIQVEAAAAMVETRNTSVGQVVNRRQIVDLPLNGRAVTQLITLGGAATAVLAPYGASPASGNLNSNKNYPNEALISIAGGALNGVTYLLDGGTHNDPFNNLNLPLPFPDAVEEFKVETGALPAQYGQHAAGAVNVVTRSGTNEIHGDAFEFVRNGAFNARDFFAKTRDSLKRNQFGGTLGGPVQKNKLFLFLGYQNTIQRSAPAASFANVPTAAMLTGDLRAYEAQCFATPQTLKAPYVGNVLPASLISPQALKLSSYFPTGPGPCGLTTYALVANQNEHNGLARADYQLSSRQSLFARYYIAHSLVPPSYTGTELSVQNAGADDEVNSLVLGHTWILGPSALNTLRATVNRVGITKFQVPVPTASDIGVHDLYQPLANYSSITVSGAFASAGGTATPGLVATTTYQAGDDFSLIKGSHQFQFGGTWIRSGQNSTFCLFCNGGFTFNGQATGSAFGDFFAGKLDTFTAAGITHDNERWNYFGIYAQDSWRIASHLTMNYGLRWEPYIPGTLLHGWVTHFSQQNFNANVHSVVYPNAPAGTLFPGDSGFNDRNRPSNTRWNNVAPRLGLAWDPRGDGRMTISAAAGIFYDRPHTLFYYNYSAEPPWGESISLSNPPGGFADPWLSFPGGNPFPVNFSSTFTFPSAGYYETVPLNVKNTYVEQWNVSLQKQLGTSWLLKANYLGNQTVHLWTNQEINPAIYIPGNCAAGQFGLAAAGPCSTTANTQARRTLTLQNPAQGPYYGTVESLDDGGTASYNSLLVSAEHRLSGNFMVLANYTWAHCITDLATTQLSGPIYTNPYNRRFDRGNCTGADIRRSFNLSAVLQSPHFFSRALQLLAGNWQLSPIFGARSGSYFAVTTGVDNALTGIAASVTGGGGQRPNQVLGNSYCPVRTPSCWLNSAALASPAPGTYGNLGLNSLVGPAYFSVDVALSRRFEVKERQDIEIRAEAFNIANRVNLLNPVTALNNTNFGSIQTDISPRIMQFAVKYLF